MMKLEEISLEKIKPSQFRQRAAFDQEKLQDLANSIKGGDLIEPIVVRPVKNHFEIVAGERRFIACRMLHKNTIPAVIRDLSDIEAMEQSLSENVFRENLTSIDQENAVFAVWEKGCQIDPLSRDTRPRYKNVSDFAKHVGLSADYLQRVLRAKGIRDVEHYGEDISTSDIERAASLPKEERKIVLEKKERGEILARDVGEVAKELKNAPPEVKKPLLESKTQLTPEVIREVKRIENPEVRKEVAETASRAFLAEDAVKIAREAQEHEAIAKHLIKEVSEAKGPTPEMVSDADIQREWVNLPIAKEISLLFRNAANQEDLLRILSRQTPTGDEECFCPKCGGKNLRWACCNLPVGKDTIAIAKEAHADAVERGKAEREQIRKKNGGKKK